MFNTPVVGLTKTRPKFLTGRTVPLCVHLKVLRSVNERNGTGKEILDLSLGAL